MGSQPPTDQQLDALERKLNYIFLDRKHLRTALRHSTMGTDHNQTLAQLGDAVLELAVREHLFRRHLPKGDSSQAADVLVNNKHLADKATDLGLAELLQAGGALEAKNRTGKTPMAEALEAVIGAVYLDGGIHALAVTRDLFRSELQA